MSFKELLAAKHPSAWLDFERGHISEEAFVASFFADGRAVNGPALRTAMGDAYAWLPGMEALLARLHAAGYELHAFSNYPAWWQELEARLALSRYVRWTAVSCLPAMRAARKPEPASYAAAAAAAGGAPPCDHVLIVRAHTCVVALHAVAALELTVRHAFARACRMTGW
jgi:phosphoglycolate phosphatase-like HAD superfamily hydrolase